METFVVLFPCSEEFPQSINQSIIDNKFIEKDTTNQTDGSQSRNM